MNPIHSCKTKLSTLRYLDYEIRSKWKAALDKKNHEIYYCTKCKKTVSVQIKFPVPEPVYTKESKHD